MEREQGLERPGLPRPPDLNWTLVGGRRGRAGRHAGLTMSDIMGGNITLDSEDEEEVSADSAVMRRREGMGRQNTQEVVKCYNCEEKGHYARDCDQPRKPKRCHRCQEEGHLIKDCPVNPNSGGHSQNPPRTQNRTERRPSAGVPGARPREEEANGVTQKSYEGVRMRRKWLTIKLGMPKTRMVPNDNEVASICRKIFKKEDLSGAWGEKEGIAVRLKQGIDISMYQSERQDMIGDITVESVKAPGPKTVTLRLRELGTDVTDKMILSYVGRMGTVKREVVGWELYRGDSKGFLEGLATGPGRSL